MKIKAPLKDHARLGASSAHRWMNCPGTIRMSEGLPAIETDYQFEGTAAHALLEYGMVEAGPSVNRMAMDDAVRFAGLDAALREVESVEIERIDGSWIEWPVDDEMIQAVELVMQRVKDEVDRYLEANPKHRVEVEAEKTYSLAALAPPEAMFGTADVTMRFPRRLHVWDLKYGRGVVVEVLDNEQLRMYIVGAIVDAGLNAPPDVWMELLDKDSIAEGGGRDVTALDVGLSLFDDFAITIVQPRAPHTHGPVRTEVLTHQQIRDFARELLARAKDTQADDAVLVPGEHCKFCPAKGYCPALQERAKQIAAVEFGNAPIDDHPLIIQRHIDRITVEELGDAATNATVVREWLRGMEARLFKELMAGVKVPGWKLVAKKGKRQWIEGVDQAAHDLIAMGLDATEVYEPPVLKSPAQIEKIIGRGRVPKEMAAVVSSGPTVAPAWDPRAEYDLKLIDAKAFAFPPLLGSGQTDTAQTDKTEEE